MPQIVGEGIKICTIVCTETNVSTALLVKTNSNFSLPRALKYETDMIQEKDEMNTVKLLIEAPSFYQYNLL